MKKLILVLTIFSLGKVFGQCGLAQPDSLRTNPPYWDVHQGDTVTFTTYGGLSDSTSWFALYGEECCATRLDSNRTGIFTLVLWASDIFYSRIESYCDTTWGASLDLDVYPGIYTNLISSSGPLTGSTFSTNMEKDTVHYDLLGRKISGETKGFYIIKKRLFFK